MTKSISTLVDDLYAVIDGSGGWDATISNYFSESITSVLHSRLNPEEREGKGTLRMSNLGTPCARKLWYSVNLPDESEVLRPSTKLKFLYGDMLESLLVSLVHASGHDIRGEQTELNIGGIKGHRDCVIDGLTVDIKSASSYSFRKFKEGRLREDDAFGYISQLSSYVYAGHKADETVNPILGAFLVVNKESGEICLDLHDLSEEVKDKESEVEHLKEMSSGKNPPGRGFAPVPDGSSGNMKLGVNCSYCNYKNTCWPELRTFIYSNGPRYLTVVKNEPKVPEV